MPAQQQIIEAASPIMLTRDVPPRRSTWSSGPRTRCTSQPRHALLKRCKRQLGTGGTRQDRVLVIQGDHRERLLELLESAGHRVKLAGG